MTCATTSAAAAVTVSDNRADRPQRQGCDSAPVRLDYPASAASGERDGDAVMTLEQLVDYCARLQPGQAAQLEDSSLAVTPLITCLIIDGRMETLRLVDSKYGAGYTRVSQVMQRSAKSWTSADDALNSRHPWNCRLSGDPGESEDTEDTKEEDEDPSDETAAVQDAPDAQQASGKQGGGKQRRRSKRQVVPDGYSEEEQLNRQVRYFVSKGQAFRIYSDCGVTGEYPTNDAA